MKGVTVQCLIHPFIHSYHNHNQAVMSFAGFNLFILLRSECIKVSDARKQNRSLAPSFTALQFGLTYHEEESHELDEIPVEDLDKYYLLYGSKERHLAANLAVQETRSPPPPPQPQIR